MFKKVIILSAVLLFVFSGLSFGQEEPAVSQGQTGPAEKSPQQMQQGMDMAMQQMGPAMNEMMRQMMDSMFTYLARKETAVKIASFTRNYYVALVKAGFTKEEALQIVINSSVPVMSK